MTTSGPSAASPTGRRYELRRTGVLMRAEPDDPKEKLGVLNPACARGADGELYLFPRLVAEGNVSRIGRVRVRHDDDGRPVAVERLGVVLAPDAQFEQGGGATAGVEDPRVTRLEELGLWVMAYTSLGPFGPRVALAVSEDLASWRRLGPVTFGYEPEYGVDFGLYPNKDAAFFPEPVAAPDGTRCWAMLHRPFYDLWSVLPGAPTVVPAGQADHRPAIWVSYVAVDEVARDPRALTRLWQHRRVAGPRFAWESVKIGAGPAPLRVPEGWLLLHHGVYGEKSYAWPQPDVVYSAGAMLLDADDVTRVRWRGELPLMEPEAVEEVEGIVPRVVFPTAVDPRPDGSADVFYGMADDKIGVARLSCTAGAHTARVQAGGAG